MSSDDLFKVNQETRSLDPLSIDQNPTVTQGPFSESGRCHELCQRYDQVLHEKRHSWTSHLRLLKKIGAGGQGVVYLTERRGSDSFTLPVALKVFSPARYATPMHYDSDMARIGRVAATVAQIQHDNLLVVENFLDREKIRMMVMEWVEGFDLRRLLRSDVLTTLETHLPHDRWENINNVLITAGPQQSRFLPGAAVAVVRDCLQALAAMHRHGIVHSDVKPGNIMLKRTGHCKIIDIGSAFDLNDPPQKRTCTPTYAAPEVLRGGDNTPRSDLASLGYVLIELISGKRIFADVNDYKELQAAKQQFLDQVYEFVPEEVATNELLMSFLSGLIHPDPEQRFPDAEAAYLVDVGAAAFHRQLVKNDLATEYANDIRVLIDDMIVLESDHPGVFEFE